MAERRHVNPDTLAPPGNFSVAVLEAALRALGGDLRHLVKTVTYVVGRENLAGVRRARERLIREGKFPDLPAGTLVLVAGLVNPDYLVEVDATAVLD